MDIMTASLKSIRGIGEKRAKTLAKLGLETIGDMLYMLPRAYRDMTRLVKIADLKRGTEAAFVAALSAAPKSRRVRRSLNVTTAELRDETGRCRCVWFNLPSYVSGGLVPGARYLVWGRVDEKTGAVHNAEMEQIEGGYAHSPGLIPVYPLTAGITQRILRKFVLACLDAAQGRIYDPLPESFRKRYGLCGLAEAIDGIHRPKTHDELEAARKRLSFDELFFFQLATQAFRAKRRSDGRAVRPERGLVEKKIATLPYSLTNAQSRALSEILADMVGTTPMNRMLQGDVGSGKTAVALLAMLAAAKSGFQCAFMAPTEVLAIQHYETARAFFEKDGVNVGLLKGQLKKAERDAALDSIESGEWSIVIGTHALIQPDVVFANLGLVIADEQHRFGVRQRADLFAKGYAPHMLVMSATPIPRTLALLLYSDLDISVIDELPPGRAPVRTHIVPPKKRGDMFGFMRREMERGRQAYVICPLVEEGENGGLSAKEAYEELSGGAFSGLRCALLHGRMKPDEKSAVIAGFASGEIYALIATTVVEVGINVPNATVMAIMDAERYGLAQLHQLRGRVGRGAKQSYCFLFSDTESEEALARLKLLTETNDGFKISAYDLQTRGPGHLLGTSQHGSMGFRMPESVFDTRLLEKAAEAAKETLARDAADAERTALIKAAEERFRARMEGLVLN